MPEQERQSEVTEFADAETADEETVVEAVATDDPVEETVVETETEAVAEDDAEDNETEAVAEDDAETEAVYEDDADDNETEAVYEDDADGNETEAVYEDDADDTETEAVYEEDTAEEDTDEEESTSYDDDGGEIEGESEMRDMIGYIARVLVDDADAVQVRSGWSDGRLNINLKVADDDKGKVIGRRGRVVHAMQSLLRVAATKSNMRAGIDVE